MKDEKKVITLIILANAVSKKILEKKLPKEQMCFVLISLINSLGLSDFDFKNFHQKHNPNYEEEEEEFDEELLIDAISSEKLNSSSKMEDYLMENEIDEDLLTEELL